MKLTPQRIENVKLSRGQLELIAYTLRDTCSYHPVAGYTGDMQMQMLAEWWADQLAPHVNGFKRDKFIKAVTTGEI